MRLGNLVLHLFKKYRRQSIVVAFLLILNTFFVGLATLALGPLIDYLLDVNNNQAGSVTNFVVEKIKTLGIEPSILSFGLLFLSLQLFKTVASTVVNYVVVTIKYDILRDLALDLYRDIFASKWTFFARSGQGVLINTITKEMVKIGDAFFLTAMGISKLFQLALYLIIPFVMAWKVSLVFLIFAFALHVPILLLGRLSYKYGSENKDTANRLITVLQESLAAAKIIIGYGKQDQSVERLGNTYKAQADSEVKIYTLNTLLAELIFPIGVVSLIGTLYVNRSSGIVLSELAIVIWSLKNAAGFLGQLINAKTAADGLVPSFEQIEAIRKEAHKSAQKYGGIKFSDLEGPIIFDNVSFSYNNSMSVLNQVDLSFEKGKMTALTGKSGAGKSTIIDLLMGLIYPQEGSIKLNGKSLSDYDLTSFRKNIGFVPQEPSLFNMTIKENLLWLKPDASDEEIYLALKKANCMDFVAEMPDGVNSLIGDRGTMLSGGQRQRVVLARAFLRMPALLILDEATSALDSRSEKLIQKAIENIAKETTIVVVAHRLSTIANADKIYVIDGGSVVEQGNFQQLSQANGHFQAFVGENP